MTTRTGAQVFQALSETLNDWHSTATTSNGNVGGTSAIATGLRRYGDNRLTGRWLRLADTGYVVRKIASNTQSSGTVTLAEPFAAQVASAKTVEVHKYDPALKFKAIDQARLEILDEVFKVVLDDTTTADGSSQVYDLPAAVVQGPHIAYIEEPLSAYQATWNFLSTPLFDATTGWTATNATAAAYDRDDSDPLIPKYDDSCLKVSVATGTNGTLAQAVAAMTNDITAAKAAGRRMTFAAWVYCTTASRVTLELTDDTTTTTGTAHQGLGWELLYVEKTIIATNATTLTATIDVSSASGAVAYFVNRGWFYFGDKERVCDAIYSEERSVRARVDASQRHFLLDTKPARGRQIRIQGKAPLTALGTDPDTQMSNTMEVDERTEKLLVARAAELLLEWGVVASDDVTAIAARLATIKGRGDRLASQWKVRTERPHLRSPFSR